MHEALPDSPWTGAGLRVTRGPPCRRRRREQKLTMTRSIALRHRVRLAKREGESERRAMSRAFLHPQTPSMDSDDLAADRQTKAQTVTFGRVEGIEQSFPASGGDADPGVSDFNTDMIVGDL